MTYHQLSQLGDTYDPAHADETAKIVSKRPIWRVKRSTATNTAPVQAEVEHSQTGVPRPHDPHPPGSLVDQTQRGDRCQGGKQ